MATNKRNLPAKQQPQLPGKYSGSGSPLSTQDKDAPIEGTQNQAVNTQLFVRTVERDKKDVKFWRAALIAAESVYYPNQQRLFDLYSDLLLDAFLSGIIRKRVSQVVNKKLLFLDESGQSVKAMDKVIKSKVFKNIMRQIIWTKMWGLNGLEFIPGEKLAFKLVPKKHIKLKTQIISYEQWSLEDGIDYTQLKNIWILGDDRDAGGNGSTHDYGLLLIAGFLLLLKKGTISDWSQYIQLFGSPTIIIKYKGYDQSAKVAADKLLERIGNSMRMTIPEEMGVEFADGKQSNGDGDLQDKFRRAANEELSILFLGNTETTGHDKTGTGAKSKTHADQQLEIIKDDMDDITDALNSDHFMDILRSYNLPVDGGHFEFDKEVDISYLKDFLPTVVSLGTQLGLPLSKKWLYDLANIPEPLNEDDAIQLFPTLGQEIPPEPDTEDGQPNPAPAKKKTKPKPTAQKNLSDLAPLRDLIRAELKDFFDPAL